MFAAEATAEIKADTPKIGNQKTTSNTSDKN